MSLLYSKVSRNPTHQSFAPLLKRHTANSINGAVLLDVDADILREIGVRKLGDRVRISTQIKALRSYEKQKRKPLRRVCLSAIQHQARKANQM